MLLVGMTTLSRLPGLASGRLFNVDEAYLAAMGLTMGHGGSLYVDVVDRKPPIVPWIYALSEWSLGSVDLRLLRAIVVVFVAAAGFVVVVICRRLGASQASATAAGALLVLGTVAFPPADGQAANFELFALLPSAGAVLAAICARDKATWERVGLMALAGALVGVAGMIKQPFLVMLAPVGWEVLRGRRKIASGASVGAGLLFTSFVIAAPFGIAQVWRWAWVDTADYLDGQVGDARILAVVLVVVGGLALLHLPSLASIWIGRSRVRTVDPVVWCWLLAVLLAVVPGFRFFVHYFQLVVPPLAVLAGLTLTGSSTRVLVRVVVAAAVVAGGCAIAASLPAADLGRVGPDLVSAVQQRTTPDDRVLVWGALPEVLWRSERLPGVRFLSVGYVTGKWADREHPPEDPELNEPYVHRWPMFDADLAVHQPKVVLDMTTSGLDGWEDYAPGRYKFGRVLADCYTLVGNVDGFDMWELDDPHCLGSVQPAR